MTLMGSRSVKYNRVKQINVQQLPAYLLGCPAAAWQLHDAKARFSELFGRAWSDGPQRVTRQGKRGVVILSDDDLYSLQSHTKDVAFIKSNFVCV